MKTIGIIVGLGFGIFGVASVHVHAQQAFTAKYQFGKITTDSGTVDPSPVPLVPGITFGSFTAVGYSGNPDASGRFTWVGNELGGINGDDNFEHFTGNLNEVRFYEVTLTPETDCVLNLDTISFGIRRSGTGIRSYSVRAGLDDFAANLPATIDPANSHLGTGPDNSFRWLGDATMIALDQIGSKVVLGSEFDALAGPITFRFYGWNAESTAGTFSIDNVLFIGTVQSVPEPAPIVLVSLGMVLFGVGRSGRCQSRRIKAGR